MSKYFIQGQGPIRLTQSDFKAQGGEGSVYVKGSTAYKIYTNPQRMISPEKVAELSVLSEANIVRPLQLVLDAKNQPVGYSMRHIAKAYALCQLFPKAFRLRKNLTPEIILHLVRGLQEGVRHVHAKGILLIDLNEMNFLVAEDFRELFFIDVDSYQTPSYPATALMESVRDRHAKTFTINSDWFSFAVVSFQMFVGIHPFKGTYPPLQNLADKEKRLDARMSANISVLHAGVGVPASCLPFNVIPPVYLEWYKAVFEEGQRLPPPHGAQAALTLAAPSVVPQGESNHFALTLLQEFDDEILSHDRAITMTRQSIHYGGQVYEKPAFEVKAAITPRLRHLIVAHIEGRQVRFRDLTAGHEIVTTVEAEEIMLSNGRFYLKHSENLLEVEFIELPRGILPSVKIVGNVMMKSTQLFEGVALQNLLGAYYASLLSSPGTCYQARLRELDGYRIIDARLYRRVLMVIGAKLGRYDKFIFRFAEDFSAYDVRVVTDINLTGICFTVLESGIALHLTDEDELEVFSHSKDSASLNVLRDPAIQSGVKLFHTGAQALIARGNKLYKLKMRQPSTNTHSP